MIYFICIIVFGILYSIKGGSAPYFFANWRGVREKNWIYNRILDGKILSTLGAFVFALFATSDLVMLLGDKGVPEYTLNFLPSTLFAGAWLLSVAPSMGEEHGAIGTTRHGWGEYVEYSQGFGRVYGIKKAVQRGVWIGAIMALGTGYIPYILFSFLFVPCVFVGQEAYYRFTSKDSWVLSEPIIGAVIYGVPTALWLI